ncbi:MAG: hypothetical protein AVDCRST_MAG21-1255, partial [uncultured Nocardioidaceae bacterium]
EDQSPGRRHRQRRCAGSQHRQLARAGRGIGRCARRQSRRLGRVRRVRGPDVQLAPDLRGVPQQPCSLHHEGL